MRMPKKIYLISVAALLVVGTGTALALRTDTKIPNDNKQNSVGQDTADPVTQPVDEAPQKKSQPVAKQTPTALTQNDEPPAEPEPQQASNPYLENTSLWYTFKRRIELGRPLPSNMGSGGVWDDKAYSLGMSVDRTPELGAVAVLDTYNTSSAVGIVDKINSDGSVLVTYMTGQTITLPQQRAAVTPYIH